MCHNLLTQPSTKISESLIQNGYNGRLPLFRSKLHRMCRIELLFFVMWLFWWSNSGRTIDDVSLIATLSLGLIFTLKRNQMFISISLINQKVKCYTIENIAHVNNFVRTWDTLARWCFGADPLDVVPPEVFWESDFLCSDKLFRMVYVLQLVGIFWDSKYSSSVISMSELILRCLRFIRTRLLSFNSSALLVYCFCELFVIRLWLLLCEEGGSNGLTCM